MAALFRSIRPSATLGAALSRPTRVLGQQTPGRILVQQHRSYGVSPTDRMDNDTAEVASYAHAEAPSPPTPTTPTGPVQTNLTPSNLRSPSNELVNDFSVGHDNDGTTVSKGTDWSRSFQGLSTEPFPPEVAAILMAPIKVDDVECKPDGLLYLPEIKYRRILNKAFGPGGWGLAPRGENSVGPKNISREYALICLGRLVSLARGEAEYFDPAQLATAAESAKSNALMRCCKDLGIASELWDPRFIRSFKAQYCEDVFVEHITQKKKKKIWKRRDTPIDYPFRPL